MNKIEERIESAISASEMGVGSLTESTNTLQAKIDRKQRAQRDSKFMIVDDEHVNIEVVKAYLKEGGFSNFITTTESNTALDLIRGHRPDIVLLDINMPNVSGLDIL